MGIQGTILLVFGFLSAGVIGIALVTALSSTGPAQDYDDVQPGGYGVRKAWFWLLLVGVVVAFIAGFPFVPYTKAETVGDPLSVPVVAMQYAFDKLPAELPVDTPIVFHVTSSDVNHGFAVYDPQERLIGQVQAMPGYANDLHMTFTETGTYTVRCLEYCGISHAFMMATFEVN